MGWFFWCAVSVLSRLFKENCSKSWPSFKSNFANPCCAEVFVSFKRGFLHGHFHTSSVFFKPSWIWRPSAKFPAQIHHLQRCMERDTVLVRQRLNTRKFRGTQGNNFINIILWSWTLPFSMLTEVCRVWDKTPAVFCHIFEHCMLWPLGWICWDVHFSEDWKKTSFSLVNKPFLCRSMLMSFWLDINRL